jgi:hypothetical protein
MARSHGRIKVEIWGDPDFRQLTKSEQRAYFMLLSQPQINNCGVLTYTPKRLARLASDETVDSLNASLDGLHRARFIVIDDETEEILIRTYVEHDGIIGSPNMKKAAQREYHGIVSRPLREVLAEGFPDVFLELFTERLGEPPSLNYSRNGFPRARPLPQENPFGVDDSELLSEEESSTPASTPQKEKEQAPERGTPGSLALASSRSPGSQRTTGWRRRHTLQAETWVRDPAGVDKPPSEFVRSWQEAQTRKEHQPEQNGVVEPDIEGLKRIRDIAAEAADNAKAKEEADDLAERERRQAASRAHLARARPSEAQT